MCGASETRDLFKKNGWQLVECEQCELIRLEPMLSPEQVAYLYSPLSGYQLHRLGETTPTTAWEERRAKHWAEIMGDAPFVGARLLDVGCATGTFMLNARERGWDVQGIELGKHLAVFAKHKRGLNVTVGAAENIIGRFGEATFDAVTIWEVIEHMRDPVSVMRQMYRVLKPGGKLYLATPNVDGWVSQYQFHVLKPIAGIWSHPEPPLHLYQFSRRTIRKLFDPAQFVDLHFLYDDVPLWYTGGFASPPSLAAWIRGEPKEPHVRAVYLATAPIFIAARLARRGDSMVVIGTKP